MLGAVIGSYMKKQMQIMCEFYDFNEKLILNMKFGREKLFEICKEYPNVSLAYNGEAVISGERGAFIKKYLQGIGATDAYSQLDYLNEMKVTLLKYKNESQERYKKFAPMYFKLCLAGGILVAILLA